MKFGGSTGGKVRERLAAGITLDTATPSLATPKGDALGLVMASRNHPIGVRRAGEIRDWRKILLALQGHPLRAHRR